MPTGIIRASPSVLSPGSITLRRTCPTPSAKIPFAGISLNFVQPVWRISTRACSSMFVPVGVFSVVHSRYMLPVVCPSVLRTTTCPLNGSFLNIQSNASFSFSSGTCHATSAPSARFDATSVCLTRRIVPAASIALIRSSTVSSGTPLFSAIAINGSRTNP